MNQDNSRTSSKKASEFPLFTVHDDPKDAVVASHKLLIRAGFIRKQASGFYTQMPFAVIIQQNIENIIRDEMNKAGAIEVKLPVLTDAELWKTSKRWEVMGSEMMRMTDRHKNPFALGPTHEESMTTLAASFLKSYKQMPLNLYQIGLKYRDEIRPRYGLIRCREFTMKDAYSFHMDDESLDNTYQKMRVAYKNIFNRCGLQTIAVQADSGAMGGSASEEYMVPSEIGEETLLVSGFEENDYKSNSEKTEFIPSYSYEKNKSTADALKVETPNVKTVEEVAAFLKADIRNFIKTVIYENVETILICFIPGDRDINEAKLKNISGQSEFEMASSETIKIITGAIPGFAGPFGLPVKHGQKIIVTNQDESNTQKIEKEVRIYFDRNLESRGNLISGGNQNDTHCINLQEGRDFSIPENQKNLDLVLAREGDLVPNHPEKKLLATKGIEVGHIFKLGYKYTQAFKLTVLDKNGKAHTPTMGTYGIGVGRTMATVVEQNHDEKGIIWPSSISPFQVYLTGIFKGDEQKAVIDDLFEKLVNLGLKIYYDDRSENPGVKFNDADLVGFPWQFTAGKNFINSGEIEIKNRRTGEKTMASLDSIDKFIKDNLMI
ncbi:MAG: proline--tRNA ligase [Spirochaetia bacterium]|nr:proline--tRNA ligase [Spirochaetia bacterium]